jgi:small conductance mechanosensitive channel
MRTPLLFALALLATPLLTAPLAAQEKAPVTTSTVPVDAAAALEVDRDVLETRLQPLTLAEAEAELAGWLDVLREKCVEVSEAELAVLTASGETDAGLTERMAVLVNERGFLIARVDIAIRTVEEKGGDVALARSYVSSVDEVPSAAGLGAAWEAAWTWARSPEGGIALAIDLGRAVGVLVAAWVVGVLLSRVAGRAVASMRNTSELLRGFVVSSVQRLMLLLGVLVALGQVGFNMNPFIAAIGAAGLVIGLALQGTLSNIASGIMIMIYRPFDVGDLIACAGAMGKVQGMTLVTTSIMTLDNQAVHVPNNMIWGDVITNVTASSKRRVDMVFGIGYGDDVQRAKDVLEDVLKSVDGILDDPEPTVRLHELGDSSVNFVVRPWCKTEDYWEVHWGVTQAVKERFDAEGISIPFPQRDVHFYPTSPAAEEVERVLQPASKPAAQTQTPERTS